MPGTTSLMIMPGLAPITGEDMDSRASATTVVMFQRGTVERKDPILKERMFGLTNSEGNYAARAITVRTSRNITFTSIARRLTRT
jgi:hypothetical protein